jgi:predicted ATP-grasp superfamily ATP-dependent carboligase
VEAPEVADLSRRLLRAVGYCGFVGVEFKFDSQERVFRLIEINARTVSGNQLAIAAGVDFPWLGYQYLTGAGLADVSLAPFQVGVKYVNEEWDFQAFWALRKSGELGLWDWLRSLWDVQARAFGDLGDPFPLLAGIGRLMLGRLSHAR